VELNDTKIAVLRQSVDGTGRFIESLCNIREDIYEIKRAEWVESVDKIRKIIESDQMLLFIGPYSSGKSTFVNALLGEGLLPTASKPCTSVVTELSFVDDHSGHKGKVVKFDQTEEEMDYDELLKLIDGPRGAVGQIAQYHHIELVFDVTALADWETHPLAQLMNLNVRIIDCPGYGSPYITNEDVIEEYIQKASFTFWMSPADKFGGALAERKLSDIKKRTSTLIPVITMSDKIDAAQRERVADDFYEHLGHLFRNKEPRFVSAYKYEEAQKLKKESVKLEQKPVSVHSEEDIKTKEEKALIRKQIDALKGEAGLEQIFSDMVQSGQKKIVIDSVLKSALHDLARLFKDIDNHVRKEEAHWREELQKKGWSPDDEYKKLNSIKREVDTWVKSEAEQTADILEASMTKELIAYIMEVKGKIESSKVQLIIVDVWEKELNRQKNNWAEYLGKKYGDFVSISVNQNQLKPPDLTSITAELTIVIKSVLDALRYAGLQSVTTSGLGAAIFAATGVLGKIAIIGGALAGIASIVGPLLIIVGVAPLIPRIMDQVKERKEQYRKEMESKLKVWMKQLNIAPFIASMLNEQNSKLYDSYKMTLNGELSTDLKRYERCGKIKTEIKDTREHIAFQFPNEFKE
jgi:GTPase Era involved in 16S rRNA processing